MVKILSFYVVFALIFCGARAWPDERKESALQYNSNDPNLQSEEYRSKQCQFSQKPFCKAEGDTSADELKRQREEQVLKIKQQRAEYKRLEEMRSGKISCEQNCDHWWGGPHKKYNAECKADCKK